jgi:hypothetical protein
MEMQQMLELLPANQKKAEGDRERTEAKLDSKMDDDQAEMRATICAIRSELEETSEHQMIHFLSYVDQKKQNLRREQ